MFRTLLQNKDTEPLKPNAASFILHQSNTYLSPLLKSLDRKIDKRLTDTFYNLFVAILAFRNSSMGLLISELGGYICGFDHAPAGTKRISNLLRSAKWDAALVDDFLLCRALDRIRSLREKGKRALLLWDDSVVEKPESWLLQGLCSVPSSKGKRLTKVKRGFYRPPLSRICVPGFNWTATLVSALGEAPSVCQMAWWTTRGKFKEDGGNITYRLLRKLHSQLGRAAVHVLDRGYANLAMLEWLTGFQQDFVIRWKQNHLLLNARGEAKKTHLLARSHRAQDSDLVWDKERKKRKNVTIAWAPVRHPELPDNQLFMVIVRDKNNFNSPMYLLTSLPIQCAGDAWEVSRIYMHRWNIEQAFRFGKSELAMESPRLWFWENRLKLLAIAALAYDFLLDKLVKWKASTQLMFRNWCHRTGSRYRMASVPAYRLRMAISNCLLFFIAQNSG